MGNNSIKMCISLMINANEHFFPCLLFAFLLHILNSQTLLTCEIILRKLKKALEKCNSILIYTFALIFL